MHPCTQACVLSDRLALKNTGVQPVGTGFSFGERTGGDMAQFLLVLSDHTSPSPIAPIPTGAALRTAADPDWYGKHTTDVSYLCMLHTTVVYVAHEGMVDLEVRLDNEHVYLASFPAG